MLGARLFQEPDSHIMRGMPLGHTVRGVWESWVLIPLLRSDECAWPAPVLPAVVLSAGDESPDRLASPILWWRPVGFARPEKTVVVVSVLV